MDTQTNTQLGPIRKATVPSRKPTPATMLPVQAAGVLPAIEPVTTASFPPPTADDLGDHESARLLRSAPLTADLRTRCAAIGVPAAFEELPFVVAAYDGMIAGRPAAEQHALLLTLQAEGERRMSSWLLEVALKVGTALLLGEAAASGRGIALKDNSVRSRDGHTGARPSGSIGFATLRGGSVVGDHSVIFAGTDEQITLSHYAVNRSMFAGGALAAAKWAFGRKPGLYSMRDVLDLNA